MNSVTERTLRCFTDFAEFVDRAVIIVMFNRGATAASAIRDYARGRVLDFYETSEPCPECVQAIGSWAVDWDEIVWYFRQLEKETRRPI